MDLRSILIQRHIYMKANPLDINQMSKNNKDLNVFTWSQKLSYQIVGQTALNMFIIIASNTAIQFSAIFFLFLPLRQHSSYTRVMEYPLDVRKLVNLKIGYIYKCSEAL